MQLNVQVYEVGSSCKLTREYVIQVYESMESRNIFLKYKTTRCVSVSYFSGNKAKP